MWELARRCEWSDPFSATRSYDLLQTSRKFWLYWVISHTIKFIHLNFWYSIFTRSLFCIVVFFLVDPVNNLTKYIYSIRVLNVRKLRKKTCSGVRFSQFISHFFLSLACFFFFLLTRAAARAALRLSGYRFRLPACVHQKNGLQWKKNSVLVSMVRIKHIYIYDI